jgi:hypothetical protein
VLSPVRTPFRGEFRVAFLERRRGTKLVTFGLFNNWNIKSLLWFSSKVPDLLSRYTPDSGRKFLMRLSTSCKHVSGVASFFMHSRRRHQIHVSGQLHAPATLLPAAWSRCGIYVMTKINVPESAGNRTPVIQPVTAKNRLEVTRRGYEDPLWHLKFGFDDSKSLLFALILNTSRPILTLTRTFCLKSIFFNLYAHA